MNPFWLGMFVGLPLGSVGGIFALLVFTVGKSRRRSTRLPTNVSVLQHQLRMAQVRHEALERQVWRRMNDTMLKAQSERRARMS